MSSGDGRIHATRLEEALGWAQALAPSPVRVATSCCGMSMVRGGDPFEALGTGPPAVSARSADLLIVAGSITRRQAPLLSQLYDRMLEPRWVIAWGACAISGGAYDNYATIAGLGGVLPVDLVIPGCPPAPSALRAALESLRSGSVRRDSGVSLLRSREPADWPILRSDPGESEHAELLDSHTDSPTDPGAESVPGRIVGESHYHQAESQTQKEGNGHDDRG